MATYVFDYFKFQWADNKHYTEFNCYVTLVNSVPFDTSSVSVANNHIYWYDVSANWSISADSTLNSLGYTEKYMGAKTVVLDGDTVKWYVPDVIWSDSIIDARGAVIYDKNNSILIAAIDFGEVKSSDGSDFIIQWNGNGFLNFK